ncbi:MULTISPECIES: STAS domain-containing protein [unclassified Modestobacter]|uniref:STAS domain-containing protein n=1 Tax=unclassified Modestobacter TaxID=2643866 RepID=UPI0022AAC484|nr:MULTISPECIES: STAS domain-containing protein [unclassified Modestobacter]MCZ2824471.1 STAS domain-containing protein [Modestobacter sp. VKM Ac-2981]MCZ2854001.1 STAS domain-containing protein [Modestobacter sp. VKM Ac-2982]
MTTEPLQTTGPDGSEELVVSVDWVHATIVLRGELDRDSAHHLTGAVEALAATSHSCWVIDTAEVTWCDVGGLRGLASAHALAVDSGRELRLTGTPRCVDRLLRLSGLDLLIADTARRGRTPLRSVGCDTPRAV